jgi:hypothetical protein
MSQVQAQLVDNTQTPVGTDALPMVVRTAVSATETLISMSGADAAAGNKVLVAGQAGKQIKVYALSVFAPSAASLVTATFTDGAAGPLLYSVPVQSTNQAIFTFATAVNPPVFLFQTSPGNDLVLNLSAAGNITANMSYWVN